MYKRQEQLPTVDWTSGTLTLQLLRIMRVKESLYFVLVASTLRYENMVSYYQYENMVRYDQLQTQGRIKNNTVYLVNTCRLCSFAELSQSDCC